MLSKQIYFEITAKYYQNMILLQKYHADTETGLVSIYTFVNYNDQCFGLTFEIKKHFCPQNWPSTIFQIGFKKFFSLIEVVSPLVSLKYMKFLFHVLVFSRRKFFYQGAGHTHKHLIPFLQSEILWKF